jgi:putative colanic acid biosynthesis UDP-glucose lipid carrier transferase
MGKKFHKNSAYIFLLRLNILFIDLIGLNIILYIIQQIWKPTFLVNDVYGISIWLHVFYNTTWIVLSYFFRTYERNFQIGKNIRNSIHLFFVHLFANICAIFISGVKITEPNVLIIYTLLAFSFLPFSRIVNRYLLGYLDKFIHIRKRAILIGNGNIFPKLTSFLNSEDSGYRLVKTIQTKGGDINNIPKSIDKLIDFAIKNNVREIFTTLTPIDSISREILFDKAEKNFIRLRFVKENEFRTQPNKEIICESEIPLTDESYEPLDDLDNRIRKRIFDIIISLFVIIFILSWLWPIIAILIKLDSKGPAIFKQLRSGKNNKPFVCLKFRTMIQNEEQDILQATSNDYRFTKIGKILRKTNLDELPQFINVLFGQMSIIGPRPHMLNHTLKYSESVDSFMRRHLIKPGISGWAQVNGLRGNLDQNMMETRVKYDLYYIKNWNIWVDVEILLKTIMITLFGDETAY